MGFDFDVIQRSWGYLFREGMTFTLTLTALAMAGGIVFGTLLAMMRLSSIKPVSMLAGAYVNLMRSIPRGQVWSGYALGLDYWQTMARIVLPQAFRNMLPVLLTQTIILFQDTSLVYVISATDFLGAAAKVANRDYRMVEMYSFVAVVYFVVSYGLSTVVRQLQERIAIVK